MPTTTKLADWQQLSGQPGIPGQPAPTTTVSQMLGEHVDDYDVPALTELYVERIREAIEGIDTELHLAEDGELFGPVPAAREAVIARVREVITDDLDFYALAEQFDKTAGPYIVEVIELGPENGPATRELHAPASYEFQESPLSQAEAVEQATKLYAEQHGLAVDQLGHRLVDEADVDVEDAIFVVDGKPRTFDEQVAATGGPMLLDREPATILRMNALDLPHRLAINPNGAEFHIDGLEFDARSGQVVIQLSPYDEEGDRIPDAQVGVFTLAGWIIQ